MSAETSVIRPAGAGVTGVCQTPPSPRLTTDLLRRSIAYRLQEGVHGGLPTAIARGARPHGQAQVRATASSR